MEKEHLFQLLRKHNTSAEEKNAKYCEVLITGFPVLKLRDCLMSCGRILEEDLDRKVYVAEVKAGWHNLACAFVVVAIGDDKLQLWGYAKEGLLKQNIADGALNKIVNLIENTFC